MATWQYRCVICGDLHDSPVRPAGAMLLRCVETREYAWHDSTAFLVVGAVSAERGDQAAPARNGRTGAPAPRKRPQAPARVKQASSRVRGSASSTSKPASASPKRGTGASTRQSQERKSAARPGRKKRS
jgi:hypothetical protein